MVRQYLTIKDYNGLNMSKQPSDIGDDEFSFIWNFWNQMDYASSMYLGDVSKVPLLADWQVAMPAAGYGRGVYNTSSSAAVTSNWIMAFSCTTAYAVGTLYARYIPDLLGGSWKTLATPVAYEPFHMDFEQYGTKVYMASGRRMLKWQSVGLAHWDTVAPYVHDKGATTMVAPVHALTGTIELTAGSATLAGAGGALFTSELAEGSWVRGTVGGGSGWYEVRTITNDTTATLMEEATANYGPAAGERAPWSYEATYNNTPAYPIFLKVFKDKMFAACDFLAPTLNRLYWSVTGDPEDWSSSGGGYVDVDDQGGGNIITGLGELDDYLFIFKDYNYYVYRWTGATLYPIEFVRKYNYGCVSERTIQQVNNGLVYFTGQELRWTNGVNDMSLSDDKMKEEFRALQSYNTRAYQYYTLTATDNTYPCGVIDKIRGFYILSFGDRSYAYDYTRGIWAGYTNDDWANIVSAVFLDVDDKVLIQSSTSSNQLQSIEGTGYHICNGLLRSKAYDFGAPQVDKKVHWVEFLIHCPASTLATISFVPILDFELKAVFSTGITLNPGAVSTNYVRRVRFPVSQSCRYFQWTITEVAITHGWSIMETTICYEFLDTP